VDWSEAEEGDPPLAADSVLDAELIAATLPHFDVIAASAQRASQETAEAILAQRPVSVAWRDGLDEIRTVAPLTDADAYSEWLGRLFESYATSRDGESLAEGVDRIRAELRAIADRHYGRSTLVISHPVILLAFRASLQRMAVSQDQVELLPTLALCILDYLEGRFYLVQDFPTRQAL
jgi:broad specificity phosphatase PhoE